MARFELSNVKFELNDLKNEIGEKVADTSETALLELGKLCSEYVSTLGRYEHLFTMTATHEKQEAESQTVIEVKP